jgi:hypothetical protein
MTDTQLNAVWSWPVVGQIHEDKSWLVQLWIPPRRSGETSTRQIGMHVFLVPGRARYQCKQVMEGCAGSQHIGRMDVRTGWYGDSKLKCAIQKHGDQDWSVLTVHAGRTRKQCQENRWQDALNPSIKRTPPGRTGKWGCRRRHRWRDAVQNARRDWAAITAWFQVEI